MYSRITRRGAAGDINTTYEIQAVGKNSSKTYSQILAENNAEMPKYYEHVCREVLSSELHRMLSAGSSASAPMEEYTPVPRVKIADADPVPSSGDDLSEKDFSDVLSDDNVDF